MLDGYAGPGLARRTVALVLLYGCAAALYLPWILAGEWSQPEDPQRWWSGGVALVVTTLCSVAVAIDLAVGATLRFLEFVGYAVLFGLTAVRISIGAASEWRTLLVAAVVATVVMIVARTIVLGLTTVWRTARLIALIVAFTGLAVYSAWFGAASDAAPPLALCGGFLGAVFSGNLLASFVSEDFERSIELEERRTAGGPMPPALEAEAALGGARISMLGAAGFVSVIWFTIRSGQVAGFQDGTGTASVGPLGIVVAVSCAAAALLAASSRGPSRLRPVAGYAAAGAWSAFCAGQIADRVEWTGRTVWLAVAAAALALWSWDSVVSNVLLLRGRAVPARALVGCALYAVAMFLTFIWAAAAGLQGADGVVTHYGWSLLALLLALGVGYCLLRASAELLDSASAGRPASSVAGPQYSHARNTRQDYLLMTALFLVLIWLPLLLLEHIPPLSRANWWQAGNLLITISTFLAPVFIWVLRNNTRHAAFEGHLRLGTAPAAAPYRLWNRPAGRGLRRLVRGTANVSRSPAITQREWVELLEGHTNVQNGVALTLLAMTPPCWVGFVVGWQRNRR
ncbi:hypothetical protein [Micromonospora chokoriensis]|uniref:hypothetical protein n=1 Tax=Micromonospora chokoriensis TaxID=356851 RepID=UPI0004C44202|nr:hypothetical protein [Micromonospora chokoriensis]